MDFEETMVDDNTEVEMPEEFVEEEDSEEEDVEEFIDTEESEEAEEQPEPKAKDEPGYVQKRIDKALRQQRESMRAEIMAEVEAQYAPIRDRLLEMDAQELVRSGEFKSIERAKEYLQLKQGIVSEPEPQPRNEQGQFMSHSEAIEMARTEERIDMLKVQAANIKEDTGLDVIAEWNRNPEIKQAVMDGEMDFYQVAKLMQGKKRPPSPMRSPNGVNGVGPQSITSMSDAQFKKLDKMLDQGVRFTIKR